MATDMADKPAVQESSHECANSENESAKDENETVQTGETKTLSKRQKKRPLKNQQWEEQIELRKSVKRENNRGNSRDKRRLKMEWSGQERSVCAAFLEKRDWQDAFFTVLPQRKGAVPVGQENKLGEGNDEEDSDEDSDTEHPIAEKRTDSKDQSESKEEEHKPVLIQSDSIERNTA